MIERVVEIVLETGRIIEGVRSGRLEVEEKGSQGPVTRADRDADRHLQSRLTSLLPTAAWLSEETADEPSRLEAGALWIVDPLDGTKELVAGIPEYAVSVALVEAGRPVLGVVHNPSLEKTYWAERGKGTFVDGRRVRVAESEVLLASRSELDRGEFEPFRDGWSVVPRGSIAYKMALVASGQAGGTLSRGPKWEWDVCAGTLLVEEAGGRATDAFGLPFRFNQGHPKVRGVIAAAPGAHGRLASRVARVGASDRMAELPGPEEP